MNPLRVRILTAGVIGLSLLAAGPAARAQSPRDAQPGPAAALSKLKLDVGKGAIERPTKNILAGSFGKPGGESGTFLNPKVEPGKVRWHPDFATARAASVKSGKPVLLFQMLGKLDDQFC